MILYFAAVERVLRQVRRGDSDLQCLQSCVSMASEMEAVFLEDMSNMRPNFKAIHSLCESAPPPPVKNV